MNYSDEIKSRLTAREVFEFYGFSVNRGGFCLSPFSDEKTPSCKVYDGQHNDRPDWCPLVPLPEGHGRLGDLDAIEGDEK